MSVVAIILAICTAVLLIGGLVYAWNDQKRKHLYIFYGVNKNA